MRALLAALFLAASLVRAEVPPGPAPPRPVRPGPGFTLNAEVLARHGYTLERYNALPFGEQRRVQEWIEILETEREAARAYAPAPQAAPQPLQLKPEEIRSLSQLSPRVSFDGPSPGGSAWSEDLRVVNGGLGRFTLRHDPSDLQLSFGQLGAGGRSPLLGPSPYLSLEKGGAGSGSALDYGYKLQAGMIGLDARLFYDDAPGLDRRIDQGLSLLGDDALTRQLSVDTSFRSERLFLGSALGHVGRAYHLFGPVDMAWSAMGAMRWTGPFPNASLDQSAGLRVRAGEDHSIGVFGGLTEAAGLFSRSVLADGAATGSIRMKPELDTAPHATVAAWGKMPYLSSMQYSVEAGRQWNPWTTVQSAAASVSAPAGQGRVGVFGSFSRESGAEMEFSRTKSEGGVSYSPSAQVDLWASYGRDHARLGDAQVDNSQVLLGITVREKAPGRPGASTLEAVFASPDSLLVDKTEASRLVQVLASSIEELQRLKELGDAAAGPGGLAARWDEARRAYWDLDPSVRSALGRAYAEYGPGGSLDGIFSRTGAQLDGYADALSLLGDPAVIDRVLARAIRHELLNSLEKVEVPLFGNSYRLTAPMIIAAAHAYGLGLRPLPGVTARDARDAFDPAVMKELSGRLGCGSSPDAGAVTDCLLGKLPPAQAAELKRRYGADLTALMKETVSWASDVLRRELNAMILQVYLAADRLDELSADRGKRLGELNDRALRDSFARLDARRRSRRAEVLKLGVRAEREQLERQDGELAARVTEYGRRRLAWLQAEAAWPRGVEVAVRAQDWAPLLAIYGDAGLFDVILQAKAKAEARGGGRVIIELDPSPALGGLSVVTGDPMFIRLPPRAPRSGKVTLP